MQCLKIQGLSPFYFSKVQLVSRLPLFANRSALALNKKTHITQRSVPARAENLHSNARFSLHVLRVFFNASLKNSGNVLFKIKVCPFFHVPKLIKVVLQVSQWPAFGGSSSLGALCSLKPCRTNNQLAKKNKSPEYTKVFTSFSVSVKKLVGRANGTYGGEPLFCTPHNCKTKFSQVLASALKNLRVVQTKRMVVCKCKARPILILLKLFNHNKKMY